MKELLNEIEIVKIRIDTIISCGAINRVVGNMIKEPLIRMEELLQPKTMTPIEPLKEEKTITENVKVNIAFDVDASIESMKQCIETLQNLKSK